MLRITLLVGLTAMTGSTATVTPTAPTKAPAAISAPATSAVKAPTVNTAWLVRYGRFDAKNGNWSLTIPTREEKGC